MKVLLTQKQKIIAAAIGVAMLAGGIGSYVCWHDPILAEIETYGIEETELDRVLQEQMEAIRNGEDIDIRDAKGYTALMNAVKANSIEDIDYLLIKGASVTQMGPRRRTALDFAQDSNVASLLRGCEIVESKPDEEQKKEHRRKLRANWINPDDLTQALFRAVNYSPEDVGRVLALGGNANAFNGQGEHIMSQTLDPDILVMLLRYGAKPNEKLNKEGGSEAFAYNYITPRNLRNLLICNVATKGSSILAKAAGRGNHQLVKLLLEQGADPNGVAENGKTVLEYAVQGIGNRNPHGTPVCVKLLLEAGAKTEFRQKDGKLRSPISPGGMSIQPECIRLLVDAGADVNALNTRGANYAQLTAYKEPSPENLELLQDIIDNGADLSHVDDKGETFLFYALPGLCSINVLAPDEEEREEAEELLEEMLDIVTDARPNPAALDRNGNTALHLAAIRRGPADDRIVRYLLKMGVDPSVRNKFGRTALEATLLNPCGPRSTQVAKILRDVSPMPQDVGQQLILATMSDDTATMRKLLEQGIDGDAKAAALGCVQNAGATDILLKAGARDSYDNMQYLARYGNPDIVRVFAENNRLHNLTAHWSCVRTEAMAKALIDAGAKIPSINELANDTVLRYLLTLDGVHSFTKPVNMESWREQEFPLPYLVEQDRPKMTRMLLARNVPVNGYPNAPLALVSNPELASLLMEKGADLTWRSANGDTLLSIHRSKLRQLASEYRDFPRKETLEKFRKHFKIAGMLEDAGVSDIHPRKEEIKKELLHPSYKTNYETVEFVTDGWSGPVRISAEAMVLARASGNSDTANILSLAPDYIRIKWDRWGYGFLKRGSDGKFHQAIDEERYQDFRKKPEQTPHNVLTYLDDDGQEARILIHPDFSFAINAKTKECGTITQYTRVYNACMKIKWESGREIQIINSNGAYRIMNGEAAKQMLRANRPTIGFKEVELISQGWSDKFRIANDYKVGVRVSRHMDSANIIRHDNKRLVLKWDKWSTEGFTKRPDGKFYSDKIPSPADEVNRELLRAGDPKIPHRVYTFVNPQWTDKMFISFKYKLAARSGGRKDCARVISFNKESITIKWDKFGEETYERRKDGKFYLKR